MRAAAKPLTRWRLLHPAVQTLPPASGFLQLRMKTAPPLHTAHLLLLLAESADAHSSEARLLCAPHLTQAGLAAWVPLRRSLRLRGQRLARVTGACVSRRPLPPSRRVQGGLRNLPCGCFLSGLTAVMQWAPPPEVCLPGPSGEMAHEQQPLHAGRLELQRPLMADKPHSGLTCRLHPVRRFSQTWTSSLRF